MSVLIDPTVGVPIARCGPGLTWSVTCRVTAPLERPAHERGRWAWFYVVAGTQIAVCHQRGRQPIQLAVKPLQFRPERRPLFEQRTLTRPLARGAKFMKS